MTPGDVAALTALAGLFKELGTWPLFSIIALMMATPSAVMLVSLYVQGQRHAAVVRMYEDNVSLFKQHLAMSEGYRDTLLLSIQSMTRVESSVAANLFCPLMRKDKKVEVEGSR